MLRVIGYAQDYSLVDAWAHISAGATGENMIMLFYDQIASAKTNYERE